MQSIVNWRENHFTCDTNFIVKKDNSTLSIVVTYFFDKDHGMSVLKGNLNADNKNYSVSRINYFTFKKKRNLIYAKSTLATDTPASNAPLEELKKILPLFYLKKNIQMEFGIYSQDWNGYFFTTGYVPSFYCNRT